MPKWKKKVKGLGGKSKNIVKLTDKIINKLQKYYGLEIIVHQNNLDEMYKKIWTICFHIGPIDKNLQYQNCPPMWIVGADIAESKLMALIWRNSNTIICH